MKKIIILGNLCALFYVSEAQTAKSHTKKSQNIHTSTEAALQAKLDNVQAQRQHRIDSSLAYQLTYDSARKEHERLADEKFQQEQMAWKENKTKEMDSAHKEQWKALSMQREQWLTIQKQRSAINKAAKLNDYQGRQVNYINQTVYEKARLIDNDPALSADQKKQQLSKLNEERKSRIKTIVGKSKEQKVEKARRAQHNANDTEAQWINEVEGYAKS